MTKPVEKIALPSGFVLCYSPYRDEYELEHMGASITYKLQNPGGFMSEDAWIEHIERTANVRPGTFQSAMKGCHYGQYRGTSAQIHRSAVANPGPGPGGTKADLGAIYDAYQAGHITVAQARAAAQSIMTNPGLSQLAMLGAGGIGQTTATQIAMQQRAAQYAAMKHAFGPSTPTPPHSPTSLKSEGMRAGEIIAWRAWYIAGACLRSVVAAGKDWSPTEPMTGDPAAGYGVHAYKGPHGPVLDNYVKRETSDLWVIGEVALWGDVIEHAEGYRAEFARVHSLVTWSEKVPAATRDVIRKAYVEAPAFKLDDVA